MEFELVTRYGTKAKAGNIYHQGKLWATIIAPYEGDASMTFVYDNITDVDELNDYITIVLIDWGIIRKEEKE